MEILESESDRVLIEERHLPEKAGLLGSKKTTVLASGAIQRDLRIPFCDNCGLVLKELVAVCSGCHKKICTACTITYEKRHYCIDCAKEIVLLTKKEFMVMFGVAYEISPKNIEKSSSMSYDDVQEALDLLLERGLIKKEGLSIFAHGVITDKGLAVLATCEQIYANEGDVLRFLMRIQEFLEG